MKDTLVRLGSPLLPLTINATALQWAVVGNGKLVHDNVKALLHHAPGVSMVIIAEYMSDALKLLVKPHAEVVLLEKQYEISDLDGVDMLIIDTGNKVLDEKIQLDAKDRKVLVYLPSQPSESDFTLNGSIATGNGVQNKQVLNVGKYKLQANTEQRWKSLASKLILAFVLMVIGHLIISYLPLPSIKEIGRGIEPYFNYKFLFFVLAGFLAQMVDGVLSMGYGVTSATCLMSFGVPPVAMSAAIHTSEIFTTGISGYSHYKFGNVNKKLFKHLVIPGVLGAVLGAVMLIFLDDKYGKWLMPAIAVYAGFLGVKILTKAFQVQTRTKKVKRVGWLAGVGGFLDSFGGGGWGPIVTSSLIAKGRSPKYTVGSVSLTEFFVTLSSAFTFFVTVGVSHWNIVLGLLIGGGIAAPIAARLAGKLPRKTMMIAVGVMVIIWCIRMIIKSL
ncbi:MAG: TSUP family transporter [Flavisolibacter sp.]